MLQSDIQYAQHQFESTEQAAYKRDAGLSLSPKLARWPAVDLLILGTTQVRNTQVLLRSHPIFCGVVGNN